MGQFLKFLGYLAVLLAIVPLAGMAVTGSWRQAWRYSRDWARVILWTIIAAAVLFLLVSQFMPSP
jgi:uncharacterized membrane protein